MIFFSISRAALISALSQEPLPAEAIFFGEIGLAGEIRQVAQSDLRLKEASKLGFKDAVVPVIKNKKDGKAIKGITAREIDHVQKLAALYMNDDSNIRAA